MVVSAGAKVLLSRSKRHTNACVPSRAPSARNAHLAAREKHLRSCDRLLRYTVEHERPEQPSPNMKHCVQLCSATSLPGNSWPSRQPQLCPVDGFCALSSSHLRSSLVTGQLDGKLLHSRTAWPDCGEARVNFNTEGSVAVHCRSEQRTLRRSADASWEPRTNLPGPTCLPQANKSHRRVRGFCLKQPGCIAR